MSTTLADIDAVLADWERTKEALAIAEFMRANAMPPLTPWQFEVLRTTGRTP